MASDGRVHCLPCGAGEVVLSPVMVPSVLSDVLWGGGVCGVGRVARGCVCVGGGGGVCAM